jgi:hypothetical protein
LHETHPESNDLQMHPEQAFQAFSTIILVSCSRQLVSSPPTVHLVINPPTLTHNYQLCRHLHPKYGSLDSVSHMVALCCLPTLSTLHPLKSLHCLMFYDNRFCNFIINGVSKCISISLNASRCEYFLQSEVLLRHLGTPPWAGLEMSDSCWVVMLHETDISLPLNPYKRQLLHTTGMFRFLFLPLDVHPRRRCYFLVASQLFILHV